MNFGPMNREGGERRLNVAITRARREVLVFSTLKADRINLARTRALGVAHLKQFLEYAERGPSAIAEAATLDQDADFDSPFEEAVFDALVRKGWEVHKQVGSARYRIDLAVVDPERPGRYLLGVECDGANYHRAKTARDRDKLREGVLRGLGWDLHRIWSTDWWTDPEREVGKLDEALQRAREEADHGAPPVPNVRPGVESSTYDHAVFASAQTPAAAPPAPESGQAQSEFDYYRAVEPVSLGSQQDFYQQSAIPGIRRRLVEVVQREGPISLALAARRVAEAWRFGRVGSRAFERIRRLVPKAEVRVQKTDTGEFLWPGELDPANYTGFRVPDPDESDIRQADELPLEEIGNAAIPLLKLHMSAPLQELVRETARLFGFQRVGRRVEERVHKGIEALAEREVVQLHGEVVSPRQYGTTRLD